MILEKKIWLIVKLLLKSPNKGLIVPLWGLIMVVMISKIGDALFTKTQQRVLGLLYGQTTKSLYFNEIVRHVNMGKGTVRRELEKLCSVGLLTMTKQGNQKHFQANPKNPIFSELVSLVKKTFGVVGVIRSSLQFILPKVDYAFIYGSVAKGNEHVNSDIDLMIVTEGLSYTGLMEDLQNAEKQLGRIIHPTVYNKSELLTRIQQQQSFICRVLSRKLLWLEGEEAFMLEFEQVITQIQNEY